jgi:hypothetical protein
MAVGSKTKEIRMNLETGKIERFKTTTNTALFTSYTIQFQYNKLNGGRSSLGSYNSSADLLRSPKGSFQAHKGPPLHFMLS